MCTMFTFGIAGEGAGVHLVSNDGRCMDRETTYDAVRNIGVKDGKIAVVTKDKRAPSSNPTVRSTL